MTKIKRPIPSILCLLCLFLSLPVLAWQGNKEKLSGLSVAVFDVDATPPVGSLLAYDRMEKRDDLGLRAKGIVLSGSGLPIVLCAVDWIGIGNESQDAFKARLAKAALQPHSFKGSRPYTSTNMMAPSAIGVREKSWWMPGPGIPKAFPPPLPFGKFL